MDKKNYIEIIDNKVETLYPEFIKIRRHLHENPELSEKEYNTKKYILKILDKFKIDIDDRVKGTGICAVIKGKLPGKTIAFRADMDALKISEETGLPFSSKNKNVMHACGHDSHMTILLGTIMIINEFKDKMKGNVKFIFQPAEESTGGAKEMIKDGVLDNPKVDLILAGHIWPELETGTIGIKEGPIMSSPDIFKIKITGKGGHAGKPDKVIDPILIGSEIITTIENKILRPSNPFEPIVITSCSIHSGNSYNVVPDTCIIKGTVRTFHENNRLYVEKKMGTLINSIASLSGARATFKYERRFPPTINNPDVINFLNKSSSEIIGPSNVIDIKYPSMSSEDFSYFLNEVPGAYIFIGTRNEKEGLIYDLHNPKFTIDENALKVGIKVFTKAAFDFLL